MRLTVLLLALMVGGALSSRAQTTDTTSDPGYTASPAAPAKPPVSPAKPPGGPAQPPVSPTERAAHQLNTLQQQLNLNQDQVIKLRMVLLRLNIALDSLRTNPSGDKKSDNQARRAISQDADGKIFALLTTDQQVAYAKWKQEQQLRRQLNRAANRPPSTDTTTQHR